MQEAISWSWRITPKSITQYGNIANFWDTRQAMWIQPRQDPDNQWLPMQCCIIEGDIYIIISEWFDAWRIQSIPQEVSEGPTEGEVVQAETHPPQIPVPKKLRTGQKNPTRVDEGSKQTRTQKGQKDTTK
jgi:hypothetical protein